MSNLIFAAMQFAREAHQDQVRKYTGEPYVTHLAEVAGIVATTLACDSYGFEEAVAVAWLHDYIEDQCGGHTEDDLVGGMGLLRFRFGNLVAQGVYQLSDLEKGNRAERKAKARDRLATCAGWIQTIKCADLISNTSSIVKHDPKFAEVYLEEKRLLLDVMDRADPRLRELAYANVLQRQGE